MPEKFSYGFSIWRLLWNNLGALPLRDAGMGPTAPANLYHFVMHPAIAYVAQ